MSPHCSRAPRLVADAGPVEILQDDSFFHCATGRLKLRTLSASEGYLIHYERPDSTQPKPSDYSIVPTTTPDLLRDTLAAAPGPRGRIAKRRTLFMVGNTRIHLDDVEGLGHCMELEVVLDADDSAADGVAVARGLMTRLGIGERQPIDRAYIDLLGDGR